MKKNVDLKALYYAIAEGKIDVWVDTNGYVCIMHNRTERMVVVASMHDMEYDPYDSPEAVPREERDAALV